MFKYEKEKQINVIPFATTTITIAITITITVIVSISYVNGLAFVVSIRIITIIINETIIAFSIVPMTLIIKFEV